MWFRDNSRVRAARQRRQRLERRAEVAARLTSEVLASADALADELADTRQRLAAQDRLEQTQTEVTQLSGGGVPQVLPGGTPIIIPPPPPPPP